MSAGGPVDLVLDASVAIKWYLPEELADEAGRFMSSRFAMHTPAFFAAEVGNTLWKKAAQRREIGREAGRAILEELLAYPRQTHDAEGLAALAYDLADEVGNPRLAIYDFFYLGIAVALDCRMVTADRVLRDALKSTPFADRLLWVADPL